MGGNTGGHELGVTSGDAGDQGWTEPAETQEILGYRVILLQTSLIRSISKISISPQYSSQKPVAAHPQSAGVWTGLPSKPSIATKAPSGTDDVAGSRTWSDDERGSGSVAMVSSVAAGSGSPSAVGLGSSSVQWDGG